MQNEISALLRSNNLNNVNLEFRKKKYQKKKYILTRPKNMILFLWRLLFEFEIKFDVSVGYEFKGEVI